MSERINRQIQNLECEQIAQAVLLTSHGFLSLEAAIEITKGLRNYPWGLDIAQKLDSETILRLSRILNDEIARKYYVFSMEFAEVLDRFKGANFWERHTEQELAEVVDDRKPALRHLLYLDVVENENFSTWLGGERHLIAKFVKYLQEPGAFRGLLTQHPELIQEFTASELGWAVDHNLKADFICAEPDLIHEVYFLSLADASWEQKLGNLASILHRQGLLGVDDTAINRQILGRYKQEITEKLRRPETRSDALVDLAVANEKMASEAGKMEFIAELRAGVTANLPQLRQKLIEVSQGQGLPEYLDKSKRRWERAQLDWREDERHPTRYWRASLGYEIEFEPPEGIDGNIYRVADAIGFNRGDGGGKVIETSPGPFWDYRTAQATFLLWLQSGLIDTYSHFGQSVHFNIGLPHSEGTHLMMRSLILTGWASLPGFVNEKAGILPNETASHRLRIKYNRQLLGNYIECKEFDLTTPMGFVRFLRAGALLGTALKNYHLALGLESSASFSNDWIESEDAFQAKDWVHLRRQIEQAGVNRTTKQLALIWIDFAQAMKQGLHKAGLDAFLRVKVPVGIGVKAVKEMRAVYPTVWSRLASASQIASHPFIFSGHSFANPVHFAQLVVNRAARRVETVLERAETEYPVRLRQLLETNFDSKELEKFLADFPFEDGDVASVDSLKEIARYWGMLD